MIESTLTCDILNLTEYAASSPRGRQHLNLHQTFDEECQVLFNAIEPGSYIRPHRHLTDPKLETLIVYKGRFRFVYFSDSGEVVGVEELSLFDGGTTSVVRVLPGTWHTVISLEAGSILLEIKPGPFDVNSAKEFAPWSPEVSSEDASDFISMLETLSFN